MGPGQSSKFHFFKVHLIIFIVEKQFFFLLFLPFLDYPSLTYPNLILAFLT